MIDPTLSPADLGKHGIAAARAGRNDEAREYLIAAVEADERNEQAWLWLGGVMTELEDKIVCLENALTLDPANEPAARKLQQLQLKREMQKSETPHPNPSPAWERENNPNPSPAWERENNPNPPPTWGGDVESATQDLHLSSPAATQGLAAPPPGTLPWDHLVTPFSSGGTSALPAAGGDYNPGATISRPPLGADDPAAAFSAYSGGYGEPTSAGEWQPSGTQHMPTSPGYGPDSLADLPVPEYQPGGHPEQLGAGEWEQPDSGYHGAPSANAWVNPFATTAETNGYRAFDSSHDAPMHIHDTQRYAGATVSPDFNPDFNLPSDQPEHDERFDCPYCGWQTQIKDQRCPNCDGELYIRTRSEDKRSGALMFVVVLWIIRAFYGGFNLGLSLILASFLARQLQSANAGFDTTTAAHYGLSSASMTAATHSLELLLATIYGVQIAVALIMAIGSWARLKVFYYLNMGVLALLALFTLFGFALDPAKSPISLIIGLVLLIIQFVVLVRAEGDFLMQKQRIVEPNYHGEASAIGFFNLGTQFHKAGYTALAAKAWRRSVGLAPSDGRTRAALAMAYNRMKRYDLAVEQLNEALRIDPHDTRAMNLMAISQVRMGNYDAARRYIAAALEAKPNDPDTLDNQKLIEDEIKKATSKQAPKPAAENQNTKKATG